MASLGFTTARWFVFCDGRAGIEFDERGLPAGLDPHCFTDLDAGIGAALDCGIALDLVLLDFHWMFRGLAQTLADPATGVLFNTRLPEGRAQVLRRPEGREALLRDVIRPLVRRYGPFGERGDLGAAILAYEFMNEPDFVVEEWEGDLSSRVGRPLPFELLAELVAGCSAIVHEEHPGVLTTIGCARRHNLWAWDDDQLGLDLLQLHWYPDAQETDAEDVFSLPARELGVRRRVILGECAPAPGQPLDALLEFALASGYLGAWPWSFSGTDRYGRLPADALRRFAARHPELANSRART